MRTTRLAFPMPGAPTLQRGRPTASHRAGHGGAECRSLTPIGTIAATIGALRREIDREPHRDQPPPPTVRRALLSVTSLDLAHRHGRTQAREVEEGTGSGHRPNLSGSDRGAPGASDALTRNPMRRNPGGYDPTDTYIVRALRARPPAEVTEGWHHPGGRCHPRTETQARLRARSGFLLTDDQGADPAARTHGEEGASGRAHPAGRSARTVSATETSPFASTPRSRAGRATSSPESPPPARRRCRDIRGRQETGVE